MAGAATIKGKLGGFKLPFGRGPKADGVAPSEFKTALRHGLVCGAALCLLLAGWMFLRSSETALRLQSIIPVKTALIELPELDVTKDPDAPVQDLDRTKNINALPAAPIEGLTENMDGKSLPLTRAADDLSPFQAYKRPFEIVAGRPLVSFVIVDFGLSESLSQSILDNFPPDVTLALSPYAAEPVKWAASARGFGHEFWMYLPMQSPSFGHDDSGPDTLLLKAPTPANQARLFNVMALAPGYAGMISGKDHIFTADDTDASPVMKQVFGRGLAFAESNPGVKAYGLSMAMEFGYPYVQGNLWLDEDLRPEAVDRALQDMELQASQKGKVIVFLHPYPAVLKKVQNWIQESEGKGMQVAPLSAMVE